jgi:hypothetical protein
MCMLVGINAKIRRAFRRITCWKVVEWNNEHCEWTGPYYGTDSYVEGKTLKSDKNISVFDCKVTHGLYTYVDESDARIMLRYLSKIHMREYRLVKCEIPMFSRFIKGIEEDRKCCYVSERLKVVKFV